MADKRIPDFATAAEAQDDDLLLISSKDETYNIKVKTIKDAVEGMAARAEAAAREAQEAAESAAEDALKRVHGAAETAEEAAERANTAAAAAEKADTRIGALESVLPKKADGGRVDGEGNFYLQSSGVDIGGPYGPFGGATSGGRAVQREITIPASGWSPCTEEDGGEGMQYLDIEQPDATENTVPFVSIPPGGQAAAADCGLCPAVQSKKGVLRLYTHSAPAQEITASLVLLFAPSGAV